MDFTEKIEAKIVIEKSEKKQLTLFCPQLQDTCRRDCASFREGWIEERIQGFGERQHITPIPHEAGCNHLLIQGLITVEQ